MKKIKYCLLCTLIIFQSSIISQVNASDLTNEINWLKHLQNEDWGTWDNTFIVALTEPQDVTSDITSNSGTITGYDFSSFSDSGLIYIGETDFSSYEILEFSKTDQTTLTLTTETGVLHVTDEIIFEMVEHTDANSKLATLCAAKALMKAIYCDPNDNSEIKSCAEKAILWVETQEFNNTEYLCRQIEVLSLYGKNTSILTDKLLSMQNADGGWGETESYKTNSIDTVWAMKALLQSGCRNDDVLKKALDILISYTNKTTDLTNSNDLFRWSTFHVNYYSSTWRLRRDCSVVSAYVYDLLNEYYDYISTLFPIKDENGTISVLTVNDIISSLQTFLLSTLPAVGNDVDNYQETAVVLSALIRHDVSDGKIDNALSSLEGVVSSIDPVNAAISDIPDPYLTSLIIDCFSEKNYCLLPTLDLTIENNCLKATLNTNGWNTCAFFKYDFQNQRWILLDFSFCNSSTAVSSIPIPYMLKDGDKFKVCINNKHSQEYIYQSQASCDIAVYNRNIEIYNSENYLLNSYYSANSPEPGLKISQKIYNLSDVHVNVDISYNTIQESIELKPLEIYEYTKEFNITQDDITAGSINFSISVTPQGVTDINTDNNGSSATLYIVNPGNTDTQTLAPPQNLDCEIITGNSVRLFWDAPPDSQVIGYKVAKYIESTRFFFTDPITFETSFQFEADEGSTEIRVYSINSSGEISSEFASVSVNIPVSNLVTITDPLNNQIIRALKEGSEDIYGSFFVYGSVIVNNFSSYDVELLNANDDPVDTIIQIPNESLQVQDGVLAEIVLDYAAITSGKYKIRVTAYDVNEIELESDTIDIKILKLYKNIVYTGNESSDPAFNNNTDQLVFSIKNYDTLTGKYKKDLCLWDQNTPTLPAVLTADSFTSDMEPAWYENERIFTSYRTGTRNLVIENTLTAEETVLDLLVDVNGDYVCQNDGRSLFDENENQIYFRKSFYHPDYLTYSGIKYIVASDEIGELVLIAIDSTGELTLTELTSDLTVEDGKKFILADKPKFGTVDSSTGLCNILFEGYDIQLPLDYSQDDYYINSDIYTVAVCLSAPVREMGNKNDITYIYTAHSEWRVIYASGPYQPTDDGIVYKIFSWMDRPNGTKCVLYENVNGQNQPGQKIAETLVGQGSNGWIEFVFDSPVQIQADKMYWIARGCGNSGDVTVKGTDSSTEGCCYLINSSTNTFPDLFPAATAYIWANREDGIYLEYEKTAIEPSLTRFTDTQNESETSPVWLDSRFEFYLDFNISFISDKDFDLNGEPDWSISFGLINGLDNASPVLSPESIYYIFGVSNGIIENLDSKKSRLAYDEVTYDDTTGFNNFIYYLDLNIPEND